MLCFFLSLVSSKFQDATLQNSSVHSLPSLTPAPSLQPPLNSPHRRYRYSPLPSGAIDHPLPHLPHKSAVHTKAAEYHSLLDPEYTVLYDNYPGSGYHRKYNYDSTRVPPCAVTNNKYYNLTFCLQDQHYPSEAVKYELEHNKSLVRRLLSDVSYQSADNLVDGLTKQQEEGYNYKHYYGTDQHLLYNADYQYRPE